MKGRALAFTGLALSVPTVIVSIQLILFDDPFGGLVAAPAPLAAGWLLWAWGRGLEGRRLVWPAVPLLLVGLLMFVLLTALHPAGLIFVIGPALTLWGGWLARHYDGGSRGPLPQLPD